MPKNNKNKKSVFKISKYKRHNYNILNDINKNWIRIEKIVNNNSKELIEIYLKYKKRQGNLEELIDEFLEKHKKELNKLLRDEVDINLYNLIIEIKKKMEKRYITLEIFLFLTQKIVMVIIFQLQIIQTLKMRKKV